MKKHLPNILLFIVVLANIYFIGLYIRNNGLGMFFSTTGIVFLVLGIVIFIFFLSIDPGYGWTTSIDLSKNYIMIFTSMAICMAGVVLIVSGQHMNELQVKSTDKEKRCQELIAGNAEKVLKKDWYSLQDHKNQETLNVYLFQKKSDRNNYKIIATLNHIDTTQRVKDFVISSGSIVQSIIVDRKDSLCPGVFEKNISIDFDRHQKLKERIKFDLQVTISESTAAESAGTEQKKTFQFTLKNEPQGRGQKPAPNTQFGTQIQRNLPEFSITDLQGQV